MANVHTLDGAPSRLDAEAVRIMQVGRIIELLNASPDEPDEVRPSEVAANRTIALLANLWLATDEATRRLLRETFVTRTGYGTFQVEWERADRSMEIEIPADGPLEVLTEGGGRSSEFMLDDAAAPEWFRKFWDA